MILQPSPSFNCLTTNPLEDVVQWLLGKHSDALVVPVPGADNMPCKEGIDAAVSVSTDDIFEVTILITTSC